MYQFYLKFVVPVVILLLGLLYSLENTVLSEYISVILRTEISLITFCFLLLVPMFKMSFEEMNKDNFFMVVLLGTSTILLLIIILNEVGQFFSCLSY